MSEYAAARLNMVEGQIRPNKVTDHRLVEAMLDIPREVFVPQAARGIAYVDEDIAIGGGRYLMEPMVFARMLQEVGVEETDVVLDIGCATGYSTAVLARLAATVVGVESDASLAQRAGEALAEVGAVNATVVTGPLTEGHAAKAPYDVIVFEGLVAEVPEAITAQLADGGRLIATVMGDRGVGEVKLYQRIGGVVSGRILFEAHSRPLPGFEAKPKFVF
ncbi:protein-L-isoaspartate O-methyltransferase family protein [Azospirillum rugosum]|uniref:Protein-L-isoaspartate O-methyltransferase n=1 Tax=Azospirillum rugosum TaxID=416170 RepID=A0ABS4SQ89_9PROT|nr:protein-L-isoaspartate O-methyltransferase [Azospirillum rugosum]MBP2294737.1 protein-L-isoaspartate(D-aspartate) O-methyltransferase [Azospirillum rugosum]MDQ0527974.1 protein-L-isoaspartate(D-aspartate) O-methyltransferase [Azospirillum rugosum]